MNLKRGGVGEMIKMHNIYPCILLVVLEQEHFFNKKLFFFPYYETFKDNVTDVCTLHSTQVPVMCLDANQ